MNDSAVKDQLLSGFYKVEGEGWRWASQQFAVSLRPPADARKKGATLQLALYIPQSQIDALGPMTLSAVVNDGCPLPSETFSKAGSYIYSRDVPDSETGANVMRVDFCFDRAKSPGVSDGRELTAVITSVSLQSK